MLIRRREMDNYILSLVKMDDQQQNPVEGGPAPLAYGEVRDNTKSQISESEKFLAAIGYISFLCIVPLLLKRDSNFAQYHGKQALLVAVFWYVIQLFFFFFPWLSIIQLLSILGCGYMAHSGKYFKIPILADYAAKLKF